jgi:hypothetical protein
MQRSHFHPLAWYVKEQTRLPLGEGLAINAKFSLHAIRVGNGGWGIFFRTGRDEFDSYFPTIESGVRSFYLEP